MIFTFSLGMTLSEGSGTTNYIVRAYDEPTHVEVVEDSQEEAGGQLIVSPTPESILPPQKQKTEKQEILNYIVEVFGEYAPDAIAVVRLCENGDFDPYATNYNRNGSVDRGIFQLNSQYWGGDELYDWKLNVDTAWIVFERAGKKWTPWTCAHVVGQKNYLGK